MLAGLAARQYGVVARFQLLAIGFTRRMVAGRLEAGRLHPVHRGVYAVGHTRVAREGRWLAAVLACGAEAVLSHRSAAALWGMRPYSGRPEVIAPNRHRRGTQLLASRSPIGASERTVQRGIPCTTPERTLIDLAKVLQPHQIDRAVRESEFLGIVDFTRLGVMLDAHPRGTGELRIAVERAGEATVHTRSELEDRFRGLILDAGLPPPEYNATLELGELTIEADVVWRRERVIVELDGYGAHSTRDQFRIDRARDRAAQAAGWMVLRYTWPDVDRRAAGQLLELLSERRAPRSGRPRSGAPPA